MIIWIAALALLAAAVGIRAAFVRQAAGRRVDHHYWLMAAQIFRAKRRLPIVIPGKFLLEDERQSYPPFFMMFLSLLPPRFLTVSAPWLSQSADLAAMAVTIAGTIVLGSSDAGLLAAIATVGLAPVLVAYNTQLSPRGFGNVFLAACLLFQAAAVAAADPVAWLWWALAALMAALVVLTHKMTTQLMLALWLPFALALGAWPALAVPPVGILLAAATTGPAFARAQWRAHADIVSFWHTHWRELGAHPLRHSPLYGDPARMDESAFHKPGWAGALRHLTTVAGYAPALLPLPIAFLFGPLPPAWLLVWLFGAYAMALVTLLIPPLKCLGGGHYYIFNAIVPGALCWAFVLTPPSAAALGLFLLGIAGTFGALWIGYRKRAVRSPHADLGFDDAIRALAARPAGRVAAFPIVATEDVAGRTHHAVLWGGHAYGFERLTPIYPVVTRPIGETLRANGVDWILWDERYWPDGEAVLRRENVIGTPDLFGSWRLARITPQTT